MAHIHELYDFTVSFFILHPTEKKMCLHFHKKLDMWNQLGGHIELHEDPLQALERELKEEAGLTRADYEIIETAKGPQPRGAKALPIPFNLVIYRYGNTSHKHIDLPYIIKSKTNIFKPKKGESSKIGWFSIDEIQTLNKSKELQDSTLDIYEWIFENYM